MSSPALQGAGKTTLAQQIMFAVAGPGRSAP
jgi:tRNA A37 threonylcarbamoyladenosine biosynthesis protein TsaE